MILRIVHSKVNTTNIFVDATNNPIIANFNVTVSISETVSKKSRKFKHLLKGNEHSLERKLSKLNALFKKYNT